MKKDIIMPRMGVDMEEGTMASWEKKEGELICRGDKLFSIETEKAVQDIQSDYDGYLRKILVHDGETVPVGTVVAILTSTNEEIY